MHTLFEKITTERDVGTVSAKWVAPKKSSVRVQATITLEKRSVSMESDDSGGGDFTEEVTAELGLEGRMERSRECFMWI